MAFSLYAATVPNYLQILSALPAIIEKAEAHCAEAGIAPEEIVQGRLIEDMLPFGFQIKMTGVHSIGAIEGVRKGVFSPDRSAAADSLPTIRAQIADTIAALQAVDPGEVDGWVGRDMRFSVGEHHRDFTAEEFLLSFSQPNFYFHATTGYDILRAKGVPIGKRDYMGQLRLKA
jgi:uncharacterized protein